MDKIPNADKYIIKSSRTYKIRDFFNDHQTLLIAAISGMIAILSFISNIIAYFYQCILLQRWNIPLEAIKNPSGSRFYYFAVVGLLYYSILLVFFDVVCIIVEKFYRVIINQIYIKYLLKIYQKTNKRSEKILYELKSRRREWKKLIRKMNSNIEINTKSSEYSENDEEIEKLNREIYKELKEIKRSIKRIKKNSLVGLVKEFFIMIICLIVLAVFIMPLYLFFQITISKVSTLTLLLGGIAYIFYIMEARKQILKKMDNKTPKTVEKELKRIMNYDNAYIIIQNKMLLVQKEKNRINELKRFFCDDKICYYILVLVVATVNMFFCSIVIGFFTPTLQHEFMIYNDSNENYAIVYQTEDINILERIEINGKTAIIDTSFQKYVPYENLSLQKMKFEKVEIK